MNNLLKSVFIPTPNTTTNFSYPCDEPDDCYCPSFFLPKGKYLFDVYGAQGASYSTATGGFGGYSRGILTLEHVDIIFLCIGATGTVSLTLNQFAKSGFNGGGKGGSHIMSESNYAYGASGGGASDVRIGLNSLSHRVIVAGGGGGGGHAKYQGTSSVKGGHGGGENGGDGYNSNYYSSQTLGGKGGGQYYGGEGSDVYTDICRRNEGIFGIGGSSSSGYCSSSGGGGGWYGGSSGQFVAASGGGGSGFILTKNSFNSTLSFAVKDKWIGDGLMEADINQGNGYILFTPIAFFSDRCSCQNIFPKILFILFSYTLLYIDI